MKDWRAIHCNMARDAVESAWKEICRRFGAFYVYNNPGDSGGLKIIHDSESPGPGWELSTPERIPYNLNQTALTAWVVEKTRRVCCLPTT